MKKTWKTRINAVLAVTLGLSGLYSVVPAMANGQPKPVQAQLKFVPLNMQVNANTVWSDNTLRAVTVQNSLFVPLKWVEFATLRNFRLSSDGKQVVFRASNPQTKSALLSSRKKLQKKLSLSASPVSRTVKVSVVTRSVKVVAEPNRTAQTVNLHTISGTSYVPFQMLSRTFGGSWAWDAKRQVVTWSLAETETDEQNQQQTSEDTKPAVTPAPTATPAATDASGNQVQPTPITATPAPQAETTPAPSQTPAPSATPAASATPEPAPIPVFIPFPVIPFIPAPNPVVTPTPTPPTASQLYQQTLTKLVTLQNECKVVFEDLLDKGKAAQTQAEKDEYKAQAEAQLTTCDNKFDALMNAYEADLIKYGYKTLMVTTLREQYAQTKEEQRASIAQSSN